MKRGAAGWLGVAACLAVVLPVAGATTALAHEDRATGGFQFVVGWGDEPAYTGFKNSVQVMVSEAGGRPVTDLGDSLRVEVSKGSDRVTLPLEPNFRVGAFGTPGDYRAWLTPTRPGTYAFRLTGSIRGQNVDETFTSSNSTFNDVEDVASIQFPAKDPSPGQLATRLDREVPRLDARTETVEARLRDTADRADTARTLAVAGAVAGVLGLVAAVAALVGGTRRGGRRGRGTGVEATGTRAEQAGSVSR